MLEVQMRHTKKWKWLLPSVSVPEEVAQREVCSWLFVLPFFGDYLTRAGS